MPKKRNGFPYEVHPTPAKGKDGRNIVYAKPARGLKMSSQGMDDFCAKHYALTLPLPCPMMLKTRPCFCV